MAKRSVLSPDVFKGEEEEEEPVTKRLLKSYNIVRFIASGSYNCAHLVENEDGSFEVLRVAFLPMDPDMPDQSANERVRRGLEIVNIFQPFRNMLGPSLLKQTRPYELVGDMNEEGLCRGILQELAKAQHWHIPYEFAIQHLEYLDGGNFKSAANMTAEEADFCTFSLIWFFRQAQLNFDFRHRDLKPENIMLKHAFLAGGDLYEFYTDDNLFQFVSTVVPVVIDYDFATVLTSERDSDKQVVGTRYTASPDSLIYLLFDYVNIQVDPEESPASFQSYDWWSLGIVLFEVYATRYLLPIERIDFHLNAICYKECMAYANRKIVAFQKKFNEGYELPDKSDMTELFRSIFFGAMIASIVHGSNNDTFGPPLEAKVNYPFTKFFFYHNEQDATAIRMTRAYRHLVGVFALFPKYLKKTLRRLLSWYPEERRWPVEKYFEKLYAHGRDEDVMDDSQAVFTFSDEFDDARIFTRAIDVKKFPLLKNKI